MSHEDIVLVLNDRTVTGKQVKKLRADGQVPAVVYDHGETAHASLAEKELIHAVRVVGRSQPLEITLDGKKKLAMIKQLDRDPVKHTFRHVAFNAIKRNEKVTAGASIKIVLDEGNDQTPAERAGLVVLRALESIDVKAFPQDLPEELTANGEKLVEAGDKLTLADIKLPAGVEFADAEVDLEQTIASAYEPSAIAAANDATAGDTEDTETKTAEEQVEAERGEDTNQPANAAEGKASDGSK
ncbi:MAG TPA: 50S ribosomal protein L25 [Candidatus Saccharimonadales bacterium]